MTTTEMQVYIDCPGCENKIRKALENVKGVDSVDIDMDMQKVTVTGWAEQKKLLKIVRKTGRRAEIWQMPYNPELRNNNYHMNTQHNQGGGGGGPGTFYSQQPAASSSYNYYKHGYTSTSHGSTSQYYTHSTSSAGSIFGHQTGAAFSDENPNACSIM